MTEKRLQPKVIKLGVTTLLIQLSAGQLLSAEQTAINVLIKEISNTASMNFLHLGKGTVAQSTKENSFKNDSKEKRQIIKASPTTVVSSGSSFNPIPFFIAWLIVWTISFGLMFYMCLWSLIGKEIITLDSSYLSIVKAFGIWGPSKEYEMVLINKIWADNVYSPYQTMPWPRSFVFGGGLIVFNYGTKTVRFGAGIDEAEAIQIVEKIKQRFPITSQ